MGKGGAFEWQRVARVGCEWSEELRLGGRFGAEVDGVLTGGRLTGACEVLVVISEGECCSGAASR